MQRSRTTGSSPPTIEADRHYYTHTHSEPPLQQSGTSLHIWGIGKTCLWNRQNIGDHGIPYQRRDVCCNNITVQICVHNRRVPRLIILLSYQPGVVFWLFKHDLISRYSVISVFRLSLCTAISARDIVIYLHNLFWNSWILVFLITLIDVLFEFFGAVWVLYVSSVLLHIHCDNCLLKFYDIIIYIDWHMNEFYYPVLACYHSFSVAKTVSLVEIVYHLCLSSLNFVCFEWECALTFDHSYFDY